MVHSIVITARAARDIAKLDGDTRWRVGERLRKATDNPFDEARKLSSPQIGSYRYRVGDFRIIVDVTESEIIVLRVGNRRDIYR